MRLATSAQCKEVDELSVKVYGLTGDVLMEAAGTLAAREIQLNYFPELSAGHTSILCGPGNNGGDGLVVARHLHSMGFRDITVFLMAPAKSQTDQFKTQLKRCELQGIRITDCTRSMKKMEAIKSSKLVVDALLGIGLDGGLRGDFLSSVELVNSIKVPVISLDTPTGLDVDKGIVENIAVRSDLTLTFGLAKPGFFVADGPRHVGKLRTLSIGFPHEALRGTATSHFLFNEKLAKRYLPKRKEQDNKSNHGRLVIAAGSEGKWGAGILSSHSAYRMGVGYVYWTSFTPPLDHLKSIPEVMTRDLDDEELWDSEKISSWVVGPGLGTENDTRDLIRKLQAQKVEKVLLDADALTVAVKDRIFPLPATWVITPHAGELSRIIGWSAKEIEANRFEAALEAARVTGCHVLLKGYRSVMAYQQRCMVINAGNSALAKAGTGDVLSGMIGALMAQGLDTLQAAATGAFLHGKMADDWLRRGLNQNTLLASDIQEELPALLSRISSSVVF